MVAFAKDTKWALILVGIGIAAGVGITTVLFQQREIQQTEVIYDGNPWFVDSYNNLRTGAHYRSTLAVGEEGFFYAEAKGGKEPYQFEWKFSDGMVLTAQNSTRSFDSPGEYSAQLTVSDSEGDKTSSKISMRVE